MAAHYVIWVDEGTWLRRRATEPGVAEVELGEAVVALVGVRPAEPLAGVGALSQEGVVNGLLLEGPWPLLAVWSNRCLSHFVVPTHAEEVRAALAMGDPTDLPGQPVLLLTVDGDHAQQLAPDDSFADIRHRKSVAATLDSLRHERYGQTTTAFIVLLPLSAASLPSSIRLNGP